MEKDHYINYEINQRLELGHVFQWLSVNVLVLPICAGELSELFSPL